MTTPILPEFILNLFQIEVQSIVEKELKRMCKLYDIDFEEARKKLGYVDMNVTETPGFRLMKKREKFAPMENRCQARMLHDLEIKQCSRHKCEDSELCKKHLNMKLKYGLINDPIPDELRPEVLNEKKKNNIY